MAKFKIGDRVRVVEVNGSAGEWLTYYVGREGCVQEIDTMPWVIFDDNSRDWGCEDYLELVEPKKHENNQLTESISAELTHITIGGKRFRLVAED